MKTNVAWLNEYLGTKLSEEDVISLLKQAGFPEDGMGEEPLTAGGTAKWVDFEVTSNRGDVLSHIGLARELAAVSGGTLDIPSLSEPGPGDVGPAIEKGLDLDIVAEELCPLYTARIIRGVKVGPSPAWLVERLESIGLRSVNNIVDITNFVLFEFGQPLHAFDLAKITGPKVVVRTAKPGEPLTTLDGREHKLDESMLVIADSDWPIALAGVMGGQDSEVTEKTTDILLESAIFEPLCVRKTSRKLKLASDSSFRFERGIDAWRVEQGALRAQSLIVELAGGIPDAGALRAGPGVPDPMALTLRPQRCRSLLGLDLSDQKIDALLQALGLRSELRDGRILCRPPSFRMDLTREIDLVEEVARMHGLHQLPVNEQIQLRAKPPQAKIVARRAANDVMVSHGFHEAVTWSFLKPESPEAPTPPSGSQLKEGNAMGAPVQLHETMTWHAPRLRQSVATSLLHCRKLNQDRGNHGVKLYESGGAWAMQGGQRTERSVVGFIVDAPDAETALREVRGMITELVERLGGRAAVHGLSVQPVTLAGMTVAAEVKLGVESVGFYGRLDDATQSAFSLQTPVVMGELDLPKLIAHYPPASGVADLARFPAIERDLSIIVNEATPWADIEAAALGSSPERLETIEFVGLYRGKQIAKGSKSVTMKLTFRDPERTLRHEEVDPQVASVVASLKDHLDAELRG